METQRQPKNSFTEMEDDSSGYDMEDYEEVIENRKSLVSNQKENIWGAETSTCPENSTIKADVSNSRGELGGSSPAKVHPLPNHMKESGSSLCSTDPRPGAISPAKENQNQTSTPPRQPLGEVSANTLGAAILSPSTPSQMGLQALLSPTPAAVILSAGRHSLSTTEKQRRQVTLTPSSASQRRIDLDKEVQETSPLTTSPVPKPPLAEEHQQPQQPPQQAAKKKAVPANTAAIPRVAWLNQNPKKEERTTEEKEAEEVAHGQEKLKEMLKKTREAYEKNRGFAFQAKKSEKQLTIPDTPSLQTKNRYGEREYGAMGPRVSPESPPTWENAASKLTQPKPFEVAKKLTAVRKIEMDFKADPSNMPFGEALNKTNQTPKRFHMKRHGERSPPQAKFEPKLTQPKAPHFASDLRQRRPVNYLPRDQREELELQEAKKHQFRAAKLDKRVLHSSGDLGVPKITPKQLTVPEGFKLLSETRSSRSSRDPYESEDEVEIRKQFKARPMPNYSSGVRVSRSVERKSLTQPKSPRLRSASRSRSQSIDAYKSKDEIELEKQFKARPLPVTSATPTSHRAMRPPSPKLTEPQPFNLQTNRRGEAYQEAFRAHLERQSEEEHKMAQFKAQGMPNFDEITTGVPFVRSTELTEIEEFNLESVKRHEMSVYEMERRRMEQIKQEKKAAQRKARPLPTSTYQKTFELKTSDQDLVTPQEIHLNSERRAREREHFEKQNQERIALAAQLRLEAEKSQKLLEELSLKEKRNKPVEEGGFIFKARNMPDPSSHPLPVRQSEKELTVPKTPNLKAKRRPRATQK